VLRALRCALAHTAVSDFLFIRLRCGDTAH